MRVVLRLSGDAKAADTLKAVTLSNREFVIGRDSGCDWPISDGLSMMSRRHCVLSLQDGRVLLTDISSNGTSIGTARNRLVRGQPVPLPDTETIYLAGEHVRIDFECHPEEAPANTDDVWGVDELRRSRGNAKKHVYNPADDSLDLLGDDGGVAANDPLALALDEAAPSAPMSDVLSLDDTPAPRRPVPEESRPEDRVSFNTPQAASIPTEDLFATDDDSGGGRDDSDPFADLSGDGPPESDGLSLDDGEPPRPASGDLSLDDGGPAKPAADPLSLDEGSAQAPPPRPKRPPTVFEPRPATRAPSPPPDEPAAHPVTVHPDAADPVRDSAPPAPARTEVPAPATQAPQAVPTTQAPPAPARDDQAERALSALFDAIGIPIEDIPPERRRAMAAEIGRSFRALADGMRELLESRRDVKIALGLGATQVETGANPLKFVRDASGAVDALLRPSASGYLTGVTAVEDSVKALQKHQVALVGGVKVSMKTALAAFNPATLEKKLEKKGISAIIAMKRKAELWERFVENYTEFAEEADDNIKRLIGKDLEKLYADEAARSRATLDF